MAAPQGWAGARVREHGGSGARERGGGDAVGIALLGACALWPLISAAGRDARPEGVLLAVLAVAAGYACGRATGAPLPVAAGCLVSLAALGLAVVSPEGVPGAHPVALGRPGLTGVTAALLVLSASAACCAAAAARRRVVRGVLWLLGPAVGVIALVLGSPAGFIAVSGVVLCSLAAARMRRRRAALGGLVLGTAVVAGVLWGVAVSALPRGLAVSLEGQLTRHRVTLWREAVSIAGADPLRGAGPGRFGKLSTTAQQSAYLDGTPHSALFQQAAEQGAVGVALLAAAFGWLLYGLWRSPRATAVVLSAAAGLTALAVVAVLGNALSFTPVTMGAGLLAGLATARTTPACAPPAPHPPPGPGARGPEDGPG
ncbi:O-antigen ligase family protein [Streptomyces sp. CAU 1734]|uniref:O-antigen ligase family protein n=1 Tax=Streptomyces sp. CAU 1734 TaxID=3140360 RepID=UPI00326041A9